MTGRYVLVTLAVLSAESVTAQSLDARKAAAAYASNLDSFTKFTAKITAVDGIAATEVDGLAGKLTGRTEGSYVWAVSGLNEVVHETAAQVPPKKPKASELKPMPGQPGLFTGPLVAFKPYASLFFNGHQFSHMPDFKASAVANDGVPDQPAGRLFIPAHGHKAGQQDLVRDVVADSVPTATLTDDRELVPGRYLVKLTRSHRHGTFEAWLDPAKGHQPVRTKISEAKVSQTNVYGEPKACPGGRWFPTRLTMIVKTNGSDAILVQDFRLTELVEGEPDRNTFSVVLAPGTSVRGTDDHRQLFVTRREERVHGDDLPGLVKKLKEIARQKELTAKGGKRLDTAIAHKGRPWWPWAAGAGAFMTLGSVIVMYRRRTISGGV